MRSFFFAALVPVLALAQVLSRLNHQGRLFDAANNPVPGTPSLTFSVYAGANGGTALWTETQSLPFSNGFYATTLGTVTAFPAGLWDGSTRYLAIAVDS